LYHQLVEAYGPAAIAAGGGAGNILCEVVSSVGLGVIENLFW
jgi:hypothetical protein